MMRTLCRRLRKLPKSFQVAWLPTLVSALSRTRRTGSFRCPAPMRECAIIANFEAAGTSITNLLFLLYFSLIPCPASQNWRDLLDHIMSGRRVTCVAVSSGVEPAPYCSQALVIRLCRAHSRRSKSLLSPSVMSLEIRGFVNRCAKE